MLSKTTVVLLVLAIIAASSNAERQVVKRHRAMQKSSKSPEGSKSSKSPKGSKSSKSPKDSNSIISSIMLEASSGMSREAVTAAAIAGAATLGLFL